ncbi:MAG TPA: radical SAM protein [Acidobacteriota bacterium]|nr:radical SAM protein [Acidobacteriota bacterium]
MKVKMILPALAEAKSPAWRPIKYSLFPPLGLATLAAYLDPDDDVTIHDEHVESICLDDRPDLVVIQAYITSAYRSYEIADRYRSNGVHVCLGGLHVTSLPREAAGHADTIFIGPGEDTWPSFLKDFRAGTARRIYRSTRRSLLDAPFPRRDLIRRSLYLVPNSIVVSRGCPNSCDFCYKHSFFKSGRSFYTRSIDRALEEIGSLPGRHLYFLDDNLFGDPEFSSGLFEGMRGMNRLWQAAGTVDAVLKPGLIDRAARCGLRSLFIGFETLDTNNLKQQHKSQHLADYGTAIRRLHDLGVMVNASFVFGMDEDDEGVFGRTIEWAINQGVDTATFHILTPYPDTRLFRRMQREGRITRFDWDRYDTRHAVFTPRLMSAGALERGYQKAYRDFYSWPAIVRSTAGQNSITAALRHFAYKTAWKKLEPLWDRVIRLKRLSSFTPMLEKVLSASGPAASGRKEEFIETAASASVVMKCSQ